MKNSNNGKFVIFNRGCVELNYLAAYLSQKGMLRTYIRPYTNRNRWWERVLENCPGLGEVYKSTFGRRLLPSKINPYLLKETGVLNDIAASLCQNIPGKFGVSLTSIFEAKLNRRLRDEAKVQAENAEIVIGPYHLSNLAFKYSSGIKVLNYPSAHHNWQKKLFIEEQSLEPSFSSMLLPNWNLVPNATIENLDLEIELADKILVGSSFAKRSFVEEGISENKLETIPYGSDVSLFSPSKNKEKNVNEFNILFVGRIGQFKGISYLLKAYKRFQGPGSKLTLIGNIVGDGKPLLPYRNDFIHIPFVSRSQLPSFFNKNDVFVFPTLNEGMPLVVLEAMSSGLPVITTPNGPCDIVRDSVDGFIVPIRDVGAIIEKLEFFRANPEDRLRMGQNARERALDFSWNCYQERALDYLSRLIHTSNIL